MRELSYNLTCFRAKINRANMKREDERERERERRERERALDMAK